MAYEIIEKEKYVFKVDSEINYIEYIIKEGAIIEASDAIEGKKLITEGWPGIKFYVYAEGINFFTITQGAREVSATKEFGDNTHAVAFFTDNPSVWFLGSMYLKLNKPCVPTKFFGSKTAAKEWLFDQMQEGLAKSFSS